MYRLHLLLCLLLGVRVCCCAAAQQPSPFVLDLEGIRSADHQGAFRAAAYMPDGSTVLLSDQGDGLRLLKTNASHTAVIAEAHLGASGDAGVAMAVNAAGDVFVGGNSSSGALSGSAGAAFSSPVDHSLNAFVAGFDKDLQLRFLSFLGADHTVVAGLALTPDALFVTGTTFSASLPVSPNALQTSTADNSTGIGFVERFLLDGSALRYATYLGAAEGATTPAAIIADTSDNAYVVGSTSSPAFPLVAALQSDFFGPAAGFVAKLAPDGTRLVFSTLVAGSGLSGVALDPVHATVLLTGNVNPGQFPVSNVNDPLINLPYQGLLRLSDDGQQLKDAALLFPGTSSLVSLAPDASPWITGSLTLPATGLEQHAGLGDSYALHLAASDLPDVAFRAGGVPTQGVAVASLSSTVGLPSVRADGAAVMLPLALSARGDAEIATNEGFDLGLLAPPGSVFHGSPSELLPSACAVGSPCEGTAGLLAELSAGAAGQTGVTISADDLPVVAIRNIGPTTATNLSVTASGYALSTNCSQSLAPGQQCGALLTGSGPGQIEVDAASAVAQTLAIPSVPAYGQSLALSAAALDFGTVTGTGGVTRSLTVTNLGSAVEQFSSAPAAVPAGQPYTLTETGSTCAVAGSAHALAPGASCSITVSLGGSGDPQQDGAAHAWWQIGSRFVPVTAFVQANALSVSSSTVQFGRTHGPPASRLPRFLYLSNAGPDSIAHTPVELPPTSPFSIDDDCPEFLAPGSVCQLGLHYVRSDGPALDTVRLTLDEGISVLVTGKLLSDDAEQQASQPSPLTLSRSSIQFTTPVTVSTVSTEVEVLSLTNPTANAITLSFEILGDFQLGNTCPPVLAAGASCDIGVLFAPSVDGTRQGALTIAAVGYQSANVPLSATGLALLSPEPAWLDLGSTSIGEPVVTWMHVQGAVTSLRLTTTGAGLGVAMLADAGDSHGTLPPSAFTTATEGPCAGCWIGVQFLPSTAGAVAGSLQIASDSNGISLQIALQGSAVAQTGLLLSPATADLGSTPLASESAPLNLILTNALPNAVTARITQTTVTGDFVLLAGPKSSVCNSSLAPGASCTVPVAFRPQAEGLRSGTVQVVTDRGTVSVALTGYGAGSSVVTVAPGALAFQAPGQQQLLLKNTSQSTIRIGSPALGVGPFSVQSACTSLAPGQSCSVWVSYSAQPTRTDASLTVPFTFSDVTGQDETHILAVPVSSTAASPALSLHPDQADFGAQPVGSLGQARQFALRNTSGQRLTLQIAGSRGFPVAAPEACATLEPGATCAFPVAFLPEMGGSLTGSIVVSATAETGASVGQSTLYLRGYGIAPDSLSVSSGMDPANPLSFGQVTSGNAGQQTFTLTNTGKTSVTVRGLATTNPFQATTDCSQALAPGQSCSVEITYAPLYPAVAGTSQPPRTDTGTVLIDSDGTSNTLTVYLNAVALPSSSPPARTALPALSLSQTAVVFDTTATGARSSPLTLTVRNTGSVTANVTGLTTSPDFQASSTCSSIAPGNSCTVSIVFAPGPGSINSFRSGTLQLQTDASAAIETLSLLGSTATAPLAVSPTTVTFSPVAVGSTSTAQVSLQNQSQLPVVLGVLAFAGDFGLADTTCPGPGSSLMAGQSCTWTVAFAPEAEGARLGSLTLTLPGNLQPIHVELAGTGTQGHLEATPEAITFGTSQLLSTQSQDIVLRNTGAASWDGLSLQLTGTDTAMFTAASACPPAGLAAGASCTVHILFRPTRSSAFQASLHVMGAKGAGSLTIPLSGTGSAPPGINLTVNGAQEAQATLSAGATASLPLSLTPINGFTGSVKLSCVAVAAALNADCLLSSTNLKLGPNSISLTASVRTRSGLSAAAMGLAGALSLLLWPARNRRRSLRALAVVLGAALACGLLQGCSGGPGLSGSPYTPPGFYSYQVTATSTAQPALSSSVVLNLRVE